MNFLNPDTAQPSDLKPDASLCRKTAYRVYVATIGYANDWAAYEGSLDWSAERVASNGDKIDREVAETLFPVCAGLEWRY